jgi:hypothetical protein
MGQMSRTFSLWLSRAADPCLAMYYSRRSIGMLFQSNITAAQIGQTTKISLLTTPVPRGETFNFAKVVSLCSAIMRMDPRRVVAPGALHQTRTVIRQDISLVACLDLASYLVGTPVCLSLEYSVPWSHLAYEALCGMSQPSSCFKVPEGFVPQK